MALSLFVATSNQGKLADFREAAEEYQIAIEPIPGLATIPAPAEDGESFEENAVAKALYYSTFAHGEVVIADDSGLEVEALDGAPGVRSARFAADSGYTDSPDANDNTDVWNNIVLLQKLAGIPAARRSARYRCVLAAARDGELILTSEGSVEGVILEAPHGTGGFGYDPLFYLPELDQTMADLDPGVKFAISHRGVAFAALLPQLDL
jgi:XTP/dITP diphosphohydrolase